MTGPVRLASGRDADVFAIDAYRVLRRYRQGGDVAAEASVMAYVAELGFPVPIVYEAKNADLVMERLDGPTLLDALIAGHVDVREGAELLADLHGRLHELRPGCTWTQVFASCIPTCIPTTSCSAREDRSSSIGATRRRARQI